MWSKLFNPRVVKQIVALLVAGEYAIAANVPDGWEAYVDQRLHVSFSHPRAWKTSTAYADRTFFGGPDGEVQLDASGGDLKGACRSSAEHHLQPYGRHPVIRATGVQGRKACLVWPSADQGAPFYAELIVELPRTVEIDGSRYDLLVMNADKTHMRQIMGTIRFLDRTPPRSRVH